MSHVLDITVSVCGLISHSTHNRSFQRRACPGNQLRWCSRPNNNIRSEELQFYIAELLVIPNR